MAKRNFREEYCIVSLPSSYSPYTAYNISKRNCNLITMKHITESYSQLHSSYQASDHYPRGFNIMSLLRERLKLQSSSSNLPLIFDLYNGY